MVPGAKNVSTDSLYNEHPRRVIRAADQRSSLFPGDDCPQHEAEHHCGTGSDRDTGYRVAEPRTRLPRSCSVSIRKMTDKNGKSKDVTAVGSRVRITVSDSDAGGTVACTGVVIEDYEDMVIDRGSVGRDWAPVQRWAIALDDGRLIFANDDDLTPAE